MALEVKALDPQRWLEEYGDYLFGYAFARLQDRDRAEEALQDTLVAAWEGRANFQGRSTERTWIVGILKHKILDMIRAGQRELPVTELLGPDEALEAFFDERGRWKEDFGPRADNPESSLNAKEFWRVMVECLGMLPHRLKEVFVLREMEGLPTGEICNLLRISATNLGVILHRARMRLRHCLEEKGWGGS